MVDKINVISADLDGGQLRRERAKNSRYTRCGGKGDNEQIQDAIDSAGKAIWVIPEASWKRIFRRIR